MKKAPCAFSCFMSSCFLFFPPTPKEVFMQTAITLADLNGRLIDAWNDAFAGADGVQVVHDSMLRQQADAWVTPTNARATMDGGFDGVVRRYLGEGIQQRVRREVRAR